MSCTESQKEAANSTTTTEDTVETPKNEIGKKNFAVIWNWETTEDEFVVDNLPTISKELTELWKQDIIENAYFDSEAKFTDSKTFPKVSFYLKAKGLAEAKAVLDRLTVVKKEISSYEIFPVGTKYLGRNDEAIKKAGITKSFVTVWNSTGDMKTNAADGVIEKQNDALLSLWKEGKVENVYFDIEGVNRENNTTDFVVYINAKNMEDAKQIADNLPIAKAQLAEYKMFPVGVFWMGEFKDYQ